jgi:hypothetical protein
MMRIKNLNFRPLSINWSHSVYINTLVFLANPLETSLPSLSLDLKLCCVAGIGAGVGTPIGVASYLLLLPYQLLILTL